MLLKEYFTDGLLQVAIVLSLLRTDFDLYFGTRYQQQWRQSELQEILSGPHIGYTQTDFHTSSGWRDTHLYPKYIEYIRTDEILRDLHSLADYRRFDGVQTNVDMWLLNGPEPQPVQQAQRARPQGSASGLSSGSSMSPTQDESQSTSAVDSSGRSFSEYFGTELTKEDMDLIDILWRQDIDLGISRDMFDASLRQELEKEKQKQLNESEELKKSLNESTTTEAVGAVGNQRNFAVDNETGELIPVTPTVTEADVLELWQQINALNGNNVSVTQMTDEIVAVKSETNQNDTFDSFFDELTTFQSSSAVPSNGLVSIELEDARLRSDNGNLEDSWQDVMSLLSEQTNPNQPPYISYNNFTLTQPTGYDNLTRALTGTQITDGSDLLMDLDLLNISQTADNITRHPMLFNDTQRSSSLLHTTDLWSTEHSNSRQSLLVNNVSLSDGLSISNMQLNDTVAAFSSFSRPQLMLPSPSLMSTNVTNSSLSPIYSLSQTSPTSNISALFGGLTDSYTNSTFNDNSLSSQLNTVSSSLNDLPAINMSQPVMLAPYANNDTFIQQLLQNDLSDLNFDEAFDEDTTALTYDGLHENWSTDSAVSSMHSPSEMYAASSYHDDTSVDGMEELEGATGGSTKDEIKYSDMLAYTYGYVDQKPPHLSTNSSSASNRTQPHYPEALPQKHVAHNHTYYLQPGQRSREEKEAEARREREEKATRCKDAKRAQILKIPLTIEEIIDLPVEQFTEVLSRHTLNEAQHQLIRDIRRRGKNKAAAQNCRKRKLEVIQTLEEEVEELRRERDMLSENKMKLAADTRLMKEKFARLQADMLRTLRDSSGQQYNPEEYTLQRTSDGDIILVPRDTVVSNNNRRTASNVQTENTHDERDAHKRKPKRKD